MKRFLIAFLAIMVMFISFTASSCLETTPSGTQQNERSASQAANAAANNIPLFVPTNYPERHTINEWNKTFDARPDCYVYLFAFGTPIGYYVTRGKPVATTSYLTPSMSYAGNSSSYSNKELPDMDGTYGDNNPGIRFFTSNGIAVEWGGYGATYLYSTRPLRLGVPNLGE
jgi:hypothetical protein